MNSFRCMSQCFCGVSIRSFIRPSASVIRKENWSFVFNEMGLIDSDSIARLSLITLRGDISFVKLCCFLLNMRFIIYEPMFQCFIKWYEMFNRSSMFSMSLF